VQVQFAPQPLKGDRAYQYKLYLQISKRIYSVVSRVSSGSIVSGYWLDDRGSIPGRGERIFPLASVSRPALGPTQHPVQWVPGVLSPGVKARPERHADHSPQSSAEVENE
jgi:hypothetical protein